MTFDYLFEVYPDEIQARLESYERFARNLPGEVGGVAVEFVIETLLRWKPGQTVTVAFSGGSTNLHQEIAETAVEWTKWGNLKLDFGYDNTTGQYRAWSTQDAHYAADIRVSFNYSGYWSIVGTHSSNPDIVSPEQPSMNFGGFAQHLPVDWAATVLHEFGHALGFHHEHQHPAGGCDLDFRWEDDLGYKPTKDAYGQYIEDQLGRRPGIYTVLGGPPNNWPKAKVDFNLRQLTNSHAYTVGPFDSRSIMKYYFGAWMFRLGEASHCFSLRNTTLSEQDRIGIANAYPSGEAEVQSAIEQQRQFLDNLIKEPNTTPAAKEIFEIRLESLEEN